MITKVPNKWESKKLGQITDFIRNGFNAEQVDEGKYPVSRIETISNGIVDFSRVKYTSTMSSENVEKYMLKYNDILFSHINSPSHVGKTAIYKEEKDLIHGANLLAIRVKKEYSPDYVNVYLKQLKQQNYFLVRCNKAVNQASIKQSEIAKITIPFPPLPQQEKIVSVLDTASALVEKQKALLKKYDLFLKSKFIEMFGDPVKNFMGWEQKTLNDICFKITDGTHDTPERLTVGIPFITGKHIRPFKIDYDNCDYVDKEIHKEIFRRCNPEYEDVLYTNIGVNLGTAAMNTVHYEFSMKNVALLKFDRNKSNGRFLEAFLNSEKFQQYIKTISSIGGAQQFLSLKDIKKLIIFLPPIDLQTQYAQIVEQTEILKQKEQQKLEKIQTLYDALMKQAFNGEIH